MSEAGEVRGNTGNPAENLEGYLLDNGWRISERIRRDLNATGGGFSINYWAENASKERAFCKVLNIHWILQANFVENDPVGALQTATRLYQFERDLARTCLRMSNVVSAVGDGQFYREGYIQGLVCYILFECAEADIRAALDIGETLDVAAKLRSLHNLANGLQQLHQRGISHQDVKPSNTLVFPPDATGSRVTKVGDLGRATQLGNPMPHDEYDVAGDPNYGPPEGLYGDLPAGFGPRRQACDLYQLGSMICFVFTGYTINAQLQAQLNPGHSWQNFRGNYESVLPYVRDAFDHALEVVARDLPKEISSDLLVMIKYLCDPDPLLRSHPRDRSSANPYSLERTVSHLDLLVRRASLGRLGEK